MKGIIAQRARRITKLWYALHWVGGILVLPYTHRTAATITQFLIHTGEITSDMLPF